MKIKVLLVLVALSFALRSNAQTIFATVNGRNYTETDLSTNARSLWENRNRTLAEGREQLMTQMATDAILDLEAESRKTTSAKLVKELKQTVPDPTDTQINAVYEINREALQNKPLEQVRKPIVEFLRREPEQNAIKAYVDGLAVRYKIVYGKDVNAADLKPTDILFTVGGRGITDQEFETKYRLALHDARADIIDGVKDDLESAILSSLIITEAAAEKTDQQLYIAREVTSKMNGSSDDERADLENALKRRLFAKYKVKFLLNYPPPIVQKISVDDDPARGPVNAPVTVVMFADFQCSACSRTEPILQKVIGEYPGKIRFVLRDYPLENIHENAFIASLAANAANSQGKFFEYGEVLFHNQDTLDPESLKQYAVRIGLNVQQFTVDFNSEKAKAEVRKDMADGTSYGIMGTPTIFINGIKVRRLSAEDFREAIDNAMKTSVPKRLTSAHR